MKKARKCNAIAACVIAASLLCACSANPPAPPQTQPTETTAPKETSAPARVKSIEIAKAPDKLDYSLGEMLDDTGTVINAIMRDGTVIENVEYEIELEIVTKKTRVMVFGYKGKFAYQTVNIIMPGNADEYSVANTPSIPDSPLAGKHLYFLGSSITFGEHSKEEGIPEFMDKIYGTVSIKEAISGTTLAVTNDSQSYVERFDKYLASADRALAMDCVIVQLSTNDSTKVRDFGEVTPDSITAPESFDKNTTFGAMEYIIAMAKQTWDCPVVFYANPPYGLDRYREMVDGLHKIAKKWDIAVIDLYNDEAFNNIPSEDYELYMADSIHPTKAGYRDWWLPKFYECLSALLGE